MEMGSENHLKPSMFAAQGQIEAICLVVKLVGVANILYFSKENILLFGICIFLKLNFTKYERVINLAVEWM